MPPEVPSDDAADEIEIAFDEAGEIQLHEVDVDADTPPIGFTVEGVIKDVDSSVMDRLAGSTIQPTAVRFRVVNDEE